jgi:predicted enzyme related to lactoylglutathione lyase
VDLGPQGRHVMFAWEAGGPTVGSFTDLARRPGIHTQWLYFFEVPDLDRALAATRAAGGLTLEPTTTATGSRLCPCDDPQGGAFGLIQL